MAKKENKQVQMNNKIQHLGESKLRVQREFRQAVKFRKSKETLQQLHDYVFGDADDPYGDLLQIRDEKLENIEQEIVNLLNKA